MKLMTVLTTALMLSALSGCDRAASTPAVVPAPDPSPELVDELTRDPERLKELRRLCVEEREQVEEELCAASALAERQRFMAEPQPRYMPLPLLPKHLPP
ncbi:MAG: hypothetical protein ACREO0_05600 [Pseudoxanthomonas sp.]